MRLRRKRPLHDSFSPNLFDTLTRKSSILIQSAVVDIWLTKALFICKVNEGDEEKRSVLSHHAMGNEVSSLKLLSYLKVLNNIGPMDWTGGPLTGFSASLDHNDDILPKSS